MSNEIERTVERKAGPLPVWAWVAGGAGLLVGVWFIFLRNPGGASGSSAVPMGGGSAGQGSSGGLSLGVPAEVPAIITNSQWLENAIGQVELALGLPASEVELYLKSYLGGTSPVGSSAASEAYHNVVQSALSLVGAAPQAPQLASTQGNPFGSNTTYLNSLLSFLPNGTTTDVQQEIINLFHGASSSISRAASEALASAQGIIGTPPSAIAFSITEDNAVTQALKNTIAGLQTALTTAGNVSAANVSALQGQLKAQSDSSQAALAAQVATASATLANAQASSAATLANAKASSAATLASVTAGDATALAAAKAADAGTLAAAKAADATALSAAQRALTIAQQGQAALQAKVAQGDKLWYALTHTSQYDQYGNNAKVDQYLKFIQEWFGITY